MRYYKRMSDQAELSPQPTTTKVEVSDGKTCWILPAGTQLLTKKAPKHVPLDILAGKLGIYIYYHFDPTYYIALRYDGTVTEQYTRSEMMAYLKGIKHHRDQQLA